jgi:hypothetical protein
MKKSGSKSRTKMLTVQELRAQFGDEQQCGEQLSRQRWPEVFVCPRCGGPNRGIVITAGPSFDGICLRAEWHPV